MSRSEGQLTISDLHHLDDHDETAANEVLDGGARYRPSTDPTPTTDDSTATSGIDPECRGCGGHVSRRYVRVMGVDGRVHACPDCADTTAIENGAAAGRERRDTL